MAQLTKSLAEDILSGGGVTRWELEQLCAHYLRTCESPAPLASQVAGVDEDMVMRGAEALRKIQRKDPKFEEISLAKMARAVLGAALITAAKDAARGESP